jgi:hypothetical protein
MRPGGWWLWLPVWEGINAWRVRPVWRTLTLLGWLLPAGVIPVALVLAGEARPEAALDWLLSFDVPMALVLSAQSGAAILALASRPDTEDWISPAVTRRAQGRALFLVRLVHAVRWPLGLALAALLLSVGGASQAHLTELLLIVCFSILGGASLAWLLLSRRAAASGPSRSVGSSSRGLAVLSRVPLRETRRQLDLRRVSVLVVPLLLGAPMGTAVRQLLWALVVWVSLLYLGTWVREAIRTGQVIRAWLPRMQLPRMQLYWWVWRHVVLAALLCAAALWLGWRVMHSAGRTAP